MDNIDSLVQKILEVGRERNEWLTEMRAALEARDDERVISIAGILTNFDDPERERARWVAAFKAIWSARQQ